MELNNITNTGTWGEQVTRLNDNFNKVAMGIDTLQSIYESLSQSDIEVVDTLPQTGEANKIYRLVGTTSYSDYMYNADALTTPILMATYNNAIESRPKKASLNLVTSGGVFDNIGALDVSELNATEKPHTLALYVDLSAALAAVPTDYQKGGMSVKFVQSSDNKYVQYRLMSDTFSTTESDWQGVDDEPTAGSDNLVKSGGVEKNIELRKSSVFHINGEGITAIGFSGLNTNSFHFDMDFVILPNENNAYKDIVTFADSNDTVIPIGYYTSSNNLNWYIGERLQSSAQYYKEYHLNIYYDNNLLCVSINDNLMKTFSVSSGLTVYFNRISSEPTGEMLVNYLNFYDSQKFYGIDSITEHYIATLVDNYILKEIEIMRSEQFDQLGSNKVQWIDATIGDIQSLVFDENSLGVSSYVITYKDYVVTQPTITYNDDYQISNKPEIVITKSN